MMATLILIVSGIAANLVNSPITIKKPKTISTTPTKGAKNPGAGIPIFINLPTPRASGYKNFCIPSVKKTKPTISRINSTEELSVLIILFIYSPF